MHQHLQVVLIFMTETPSSAILARGNDISFRPLRFFELHSGI